MQQIINFVIRNKNFLLFLLLFVVSIGLTIQTHSYHKSQFISSANRITGGTYGLFSSVNQYFHLKGENEKLLKENERLRQRLYNSKTLAVDTTDLGLDSIYNVVAAEVFKNSFTANYNFITINKGLKDSIGEDYGVITDRGIVGIVDQSSKKYSRVISILNKNIRINAQLKSSNHFGSLVWDGKSPNEVQLVDISKFADVQVNDTITTGGQSAIFPKGIGIGTVIDITDDLGGDTYKLQIQLFNDMTNLGFVYVISNRDAEERKVIENTTNE